MDETVEEGPRGDDERRARIPVAIFHRQAGDAARPVVVILAGAEGGNGAGRRFGPVLARLGYAAVSLPGLTFGKPFPGASLRPALIASAASQHFRLDFDRVGRELFPATRGLRSIDGLVRA